MPMPIRQGVGPEVPAGMRVYTHTHTHVDACSSKEQELGLKGQDADPPELVRLPLSVPLPTRLPRPAGGRSLLRVHSIPGVRGALRAQSCSPAHKATATSGRRLRGLTCY